MATLPEVCSELANRLSPVVTAVYPAPASLPGNVPVAMVYGHAGTLSYRGGSEQEWLDTIRVQVLVAPSTTSQALEELDLLIDPIADLFRADDTEKHTLGYTVDFCKLQSYETGQGFEYANQSFYGATLLFSVKRRRFAGA
jgi:hypothetical protein